MFGSKVKSINNYQHYKATNLDQNISLFMVYLYLLLKQNCQRRKFW